jgi:hypothetical protein
VIDLGVIDALPDPAGPHEGWRPRVGPAVVVAAIVVLLLGGAAAPGGTGLTALGAVSATGQVGYQVDGDALYVSESGPQGNVISRYDLPSRHRRWGTQVTLLVSAANVWVAGGVVLVSTYDVGVSGDHTIALDAGTGRVLWRSAFAENGVLPGTGLVLLTRLASQDESNYPASEMRAVRLRDGAPAWTYPTREGCQHALPDEEGTVAVLCPGGDLRLLDPATGAVRRSVLLPVSPPNPAVRLADGSMRWDIGPVLRVVGGQVLIGYGQGDRTTVAAYDAATLRPQWTIRLAGQMYGVDGCGGALCLSGDTGLAVLDRASGQLRWADDRQVVDPLGGRYAVLSPGGPPGGVATSTVVDLDNGRSVYYLGIWQWSGHAGRADYVTYWEPAKARTWFGVLSTDPVAVHVLGFTRDAIESGCAGSGRYVVCETVRHRLLIWRYSP